MVKNQKLQEVALTSHIAETECMLQSLLAYYVVKKLFRPRLLKTVAFLQVLKITTFEKGLVGLMLLRNY